MGAWRWGENLPVEFFVGPHGSASWTLCSDLHRLQSEPRPQALPQLLKLRRVHLHDALRHLRRRWLLPWHQPRAQVVRQREQLPSRPGGDLRHHGLERERVEAPARGLFQQGAEPSERAERAQASASRPYGSPSMPPVARSQWVVLLPLGRA